MADRRQLTVVMFADIVGYTALMQHNEDEALSLLDRFKDELKLTIKECRGEIVQLYGDGCLAVFTSAADAVSSASILQEQFREKPLVPVRIGIHLGDVLFKEGNISGECVTITSRIENMGVPGSVLLSDAVKDQLRNKPEFEFISLGEYEFENVEDSMEVFALTRKGFPVPLPKNAKRKIYEPKTFKSIAVLPFLNMSSDPEQEYFSDGMAEEILNSLTHLKELKVAGRISSFQFKGKNVPTKEVGEKLGVKTILEGSIRKQGKRVRITTKLINVDDGYQLWSQSFDREMTDIFSIQEEIAISVTEALKLTLLKKDRELITKSPTQNPEAYEMYLKGMFHLNKRGASLFSSIQYFQSAIETDPDFALAYAMIADAYVLIALFGLMPPREVMNNAKKLAEKAISLDPALCEPYHALGFYYNCIEWNWPEAKKNYLKSIQLNPNNAEVHYRFGWNYLTWVEGDFQLALQHGEIAVLLEPLSSIGHAIYSLILYAAGNFKEAIVACEKGIELDPHSFLCVMNKGNVYIAMRQYDEAIATGKIAMEISNRHNFVVNGLIWNYCLTGQLEEARALFTEIKERSKKEYIPNALLGISAAYLNDLDDSFEYFEKAYHDRDPILLTIKNLDWTPASLREDPRFHHLIDRIGFPK
jgi:TolB-like protein/class 3 adenylate cyclase/tetratricopeptide (TPR) repeat protein